MTLKNNFIIIQNQITNQEEILMSLSKYVKEMINHSSESTQALSIRLPETMINEIDEISQIVDESRSSLIQTFIKAGLEEVEKQLNNQENNFQPIETKDKQRYFLLNTAYNFDKDFHYTMLKNGEASADTTWKKNIEFLKEGDIIFLYQSGHGIVGYGKADTKLEIRDYQNGEELLKGEWYARKLNEFVKLEKPFSAKKCKDTTKSNLNFRNGMSQLTKAQGESLYAFFEKN